jgi:hypothetical protein
MTKDPMLRTPLVLAIAGLGLAATGCQVGPHAIKMGHPEYASAVGAVMDQQLLLNLVRLRYRAAPVWLEISSISTQLEAIASGDISGTLNEDVSLGGAKNPDSLHMGAGVGYAERPTISYSILGGEAFIKRLLTPIPILGVSLLAESGWRSDRVLRLTVERMNGLKNAPRASGPTPAYVPDYKEFQEAARLMRELAQEGLVDFELATRTKQISDLIPVDGVEGDMLVDAAKEGLQFYARDDGKMMALTQEERILMMRVIERAPESAKVGRLRELLRLAPEQMRYDLVDPADGDYDPLEANSALSNIAIDTRSLMGVMYYLSNAVDVPAEHMTLGPVTETLDSEGNPFDWAEVLGDLFAVHHSSTRPARAAVAVQYRGNWFYIADDDEDSLSTFALVNQLASLTAGEKRGPAPVLTLPVGG